MDTQSQKIASTSHGNILWTGKPVFTGFLRKHAHYVLLVAGYFILSRNTLHFGVDSINIPCFGFAARLPFQPDAILIIISAFFILHGLLFTWLSHSAMYLVQSVVVITGLHYAPIFGLKTDMFMGGYAFFLFSMLELYRYSFHYRIDSAGITFERRWIPGACARFVPFGHIASLLSFDSPFVHVVVLNRMSYFNYGTIAVLDESGFGIDSSFIFGAAGFQGGASLRPPATGVSIGAAALGGAARGVQRANRDPRNCLFAVPFPETVREIIRKRLK